MTRRPITLALAAAGCLWAWAGLAGEGRDIAPGAHAEHCLELPAGRALDYHFKASAPLRFNVHYHVGRDVLFPVHEREVQADAGRVRLETTHGVCLMWTNTATQSVRVEFEARIDDADTGSR